MAVNRSISTPRNIFNDTLGNAIELFGTASAGDILIFDGTNWVGSGTTGTGRIGTLQATNVNNNAGGPLNVGTTDNQDLNFFRDGVLQFLLSALGAEFGVPITNIPGSDLTVGTSDNQDLDIIRNNITQLLFTAAGIELGVPLTNAAGTPITFGTSDNQAVSVIQNGTTAMFVDSTGVNVSTNLTLAIGGYHNLYTVRLGIFEYDNLIGAPVTIPDTNWTRIPIDNAGSLNNTYLGFPFDTNYDIESRITFDGIGAAFDIVARARLDGTEHARIYFATVTPEAEQTMILKFTFTVPLLTNVTLDIQIWQNSGAALNVRAHEMRSSGLY